MRAFIFLNEMKTKAFLIVSFFGLLLQGCSHVSVITDRTEMAADDEVLYSALFYIHADADYLFHDSEGNARQADERALSAAMKIGSEASSGEVFIIHHKRQRKILGLFPRRSNEMFYFRNGELQRQLTYRYEDSSEPFLSTEKIFYEQVATLSDNGLPQKYFFFFGHELPNKDGKGYHNSMPNVDVSGETLSAGMKQFLSEPTRKFDLVTLSTCSNGTPQMAEQMIPVSHYMLASPQNLHLSYMDVDAFLNLEENPATPMPEIAEAMASRTFERLKREVRTEVALTIYDLREVSLYIDELAAMVEEYEQEYNPNRYRDNIDCADLDFFYSEVFKNGLETWFSPAAFGTRASAGVHSGWGCKGN